MISPRPLSTAKSGWVRRYNIPLLLLLSGCAASAVDDSGLPRTPIFITGAGDTIAMTESLRIGTLAGDPDYQFSSLQQVRPRPDGGVIVLDLSRFSGEVAVRHFAPTGRLLRTIGRQGPGPGEYGDFPSTTVLTDGSLVLADQGSARISLFDPAGGFVREMRGPSGIVELVPTVGGGWYIGAVSGRAEGLPRRITYSRYAADGELIDTMPAPNAYHEGEYGADFQTANVVILPDGRMVVSKSDSIRFTIFGPTSDTTIARASDRALYTEEEKLDRARVHAAIQRRSGQSGEMAALPDLKPAFRYMISDHAGRILFLRRTKGYRLSDTTDMSATQLVLRESLELDVFDSDGDYRGRLVAPREVQSRGFGFAEDALWLSHEAPSGEQQLVRWTPERVVW